MTAAAVAKRSRLLAAMAGVLVLALAASLYAVSQERDDSDLREAMPPAVTFDLARPDAVLQTASLESLPRDVLDVPLLRDLLSEDFLFYYESNEDRLGIEGALRRIAYEHQLSLGDQILANILSAPAEAAFWEGYDGRLKHYAMVVGTQGLGKGIDLLASVAANDKQLARVGRLTLRETVNRSSAGHAITVDVDADVYRLSYGYNRSLFFMLLRDRLLVASDMEIALPPRERHAAWAKLFAPLFAKGGNPDVFLSAYDADSRSARHTIVFGARYLSFGYQRFFPSLKAVKFVKDADGWRTEALAAGPIRGDVTATAGLWKAVPHAPSLCLAVPADAEAVRAVAAKLAPPRHAERNALLGQQLQSASAVCWFSDSKLYTPLVIAQVRSQPWLKEYLRDLFGRSVGGWEAGILTEAQRKQLEERKNREDSMFSFGEDEEEAIRPASYVPTFPAKERSSAAGTVWSRVVSSRYGIHDAKGHELADKMRSARYFNVTLAYWRGFVLFSPDDRLVEKAMAVLDKKFPPLADSLANVKSNVFMVLNPGSFGRLVRESSLDSLPGSQESVFRASVSRQLFPNLEKLNRYGAFALSMPQGGADGTVKWERLQWHEFRL